MGCAKAPFTGSVILKQSLLATEEMDINAPPDVLSVLDDGVDRKLRTLHDVVKTKKRLFVCALDFCVLDSCLNALDAGLSEVYMVLDAARAAHIPGVGTFGSGFLSNPTEVVDKMEKAGVKVVDSATLSGVSSGQLKALLELPDEKVLAPLGLSRAQVECKLLDDGKFKVELTGKLANVSLSDCTGRCSPRARVPISWTNAPKESVELCWADPVVTSANAAESLQKNFLAVSASPELCFLAYGGFLLIDSQGKVAVTGDTTESSLRFEEPRKWREAYTPVLKEAGRFKPVTLPALLRQDFRFGIHRKDLVAGPEHWAPSETGAYVYLLSSGSSIYFPVEQAAEANSLLSKMTQLLQQDLRGKDDATWPRLHDSPEST
eukprot:symbB.v1.2.021189.t1/scaffold1779.1/size154953/17